jgi:hypothetical protein
VSAASDASTAPAAWDVSDASGFAARCFRSGALADDVGDVDDLDDVEAGRAAVRAERVRAGRAGAGDDYGRDHELGRGVEGMDLGGHARSDAMTRSRVVGVGRPGWNEIPVVRMVRRASS